MKAPPFHYHRARTLDEALTILAENENAKILAGGQSLVPMMNFRYVLPDHLVDINAVADLAGIEEIASEALRIGAMTRQRHAETSQPLRERAPIFGEALAQVGHRQTRNRGTIGGSLCHLDPAAELPALALLYDAQLEIASVRGRRRGAMRDFVAGYMSADLAVDEALVAIEIAPWAPRAGHAFLEHARRRGDFAIASAACLVETDARTGRATRARVVVGGLADRAMRLEEAEALIVDATPGDDLFAAAGRICLALDAAPDIHAGADYRRHVASTLVRRALALAWSRVDAPARRAA